nr:uncharacterized protein LOC116150192 [Camelus dromedarius]
MRTGQKRRARMWLCAPGGLEFLLYTGGGNKAMDKIQSWPSKNLTSPKRDESFPYLLLDDILRQQVRQLSSSPFCRQRSPRSGEDTYRAHHQGSTGEHFQHCDAKVITTHLIPSDGLLYARTPCLSVGRSVEGTRRRRAEPEKDEHPGHETRTTASGGQPGPGGSTPAPPTPGPSWQGPCVCKMSDHVLFSVPSPAVSTEMATEGPCVEGLKERASAYKGVPGPSAQPVSLQTRLTQPLPSPASGSSSIIGGPRPLL